MQNNLMREPKMSGPLAGIKVLDLTRFIAGPYCAMMLADMGAEVVKVETSRAGDPGRNHPPLVGGESLYHQVYNRNKSAMLLNLRSEAGRAALRELATKADILVENFRPGTMEDMGLGWETLHTLNPKLILASISGFGPDGPLSRKPCFDVIAQAMSGIMSITGAVDGPPMRCGTFITDYASGMYSAMGILAALQARHTTGVGQVVNVSLLDSALSLLMTAIPEQKMLGREMTRRGNRDRYGAPSSTYRTADNEWIFIAAGNGLIFPRLAKALGRPDLTEDTRFDTMEHRLENFDALEAIVAEWMAARTATEIIRQLAIDDVPCAKVNTISEMLASGELELQKRLVEVDHPRLGKVPMQGVTMHLSATPLSVRTYAPTLGEHTDEILKSWLGWSDADCAHLVETV